MPSNEAEETEETEELPIEDYKNLVKMFKGLLDTYGSFATELGEIHKHQEKAYKAMFSLDLAEKMPEILGIVAEKGPPELSRFLTKMFFKISVFLPRIGKLMDLSANEKIKLGKNLKSLAKDFDKMLDWVEKMEKE